MSHAVHESDLTRPASAPAMLEVKDLEVSYGKIKAVKGISFTVGQGEVVSLIGTNGAGKTTTLRTISGLLRPSAGSITFQGKRIDDVPAHEIVVLGIAHCPEGRRIFPQMTVEENLLLGAFTREDGEIGKDLQEAYELFPILQERSKQPAGTFSGGEQQMLAMGRAMMSRPKLLMLDEPSMGLSPLMMKRIMTTVRTLQDRGTTILLVEQNAQAALRLANKGYVLEVGKVVLQGTGRELLTSDDVRKAYLGED
ncbi:leucine/isoleucine/valine transporter subunit; ATP-binding component of ABC superfamily [Nostocoides australiense Ben110]|uniref:Leucine/isoleucine/valine transporter subunit ATP-binding component of ABC superfamily n=2 Tax=Nostocoides australiense TaxID=99480 RepID=W6JUN7_9MICO|nr:ABC transporter ATP-binding protein [Actinomycetota bacterium]CCH72271.1 leucine/isoleucine/valine transporter subunit; ATP-binding component of ABC superfamily [Tetrasphaera australiensis Ben110]